MATYFYHLCMHLQSAHTIWLCTCFLQKVYFSIPWIWGWPCDMLWPVGHEQMWHWKRLEKSQYVEICSLLLLSATLPPPACEISTGQLVTWWVTHGLVTSIMPTDNQPSEWGHKPPADTHRPQMNHPGLVHFATLTHRTIICYPAKANRKRKKKKETLWKIGRICKAHTITQKFHSRYMLNRNASKDMYKSVHCTTVLIRPN